MPRSRRPFSLLSILPLLIIPIVCGAIFLAQNAPRDWSLHWTKPTTAIAATSTAEFSAVSTPRGYDVLWQLPGGSLTFSRLNNRGRPIVPSLTLKGSPETNNQSIALARAGAMDVGVWREDLANGSRLQAVILRPGSAPIYRTLANGPWSLEHPRAFTDGNTVDVVFSWQRGAFNVYLARVGQRGPIAQPRVLTDVRDYAFNPHGIIERSGAISLMYMQTCCSGTAMRMMYARYTPFGRPLGPARSLGIITSVGGPNSAATPPRWGLDVERDGPRVAAVWAGDQGIMAAEWKDGKTVVPPHPAIPVPAPPTLALSIVGTQRELVWQQAFDLGFMLSTVRLNSGLNAIDAPDRVAFHGESDDVPVPVTVHHAPALLWQASPGGSVDTRIELSRFSPQPLSAPDIWSRFGLGLTNPVSSFAILLFGGIAVGILLAAANVVLIIALVGLYLLGFRKVRAKWKWYAYAVAISVVLFALFIYLGAPTPPVLFLTNFTQSSGILALGGMLIFIAWMARTILRRVEDVYRAGIMAAAALFFIGFLQALVLMQGQIAKI